MKFSTRTTYGLRAMICLASSYKKDSVSLPVIAKQEKLSLGYLERLFRNLKKAKLITSQKGKSGGYSLAKNPKEINIFSIISSLEGEMNPFHCIQDDGKILCGNKCNCGVTKVLLSVQDSVNKTLKKMKLSDLL